MTVEQYPHKVGWVGIGRMGSALATRLLDAGVDLSVYNRTRSKAEALEPLGAKVVDAQRIWRSATLSSPWWPDPRMCSTSPSDRGESSQETRGQA